MIIYKTTNLINGRFYVGQDSHNDSSYYGSGILLGSAIKKYGKENFKKEILCECQSKKELDEKEKFWIKKLKATRKNIGYNLTEGGTGGVTWKENHPMWKKHHTKKSKEKMRNSHNEEQKGTNIHFWKYYYKFISPVGKVYKNITSVNEFVLENGLKQLYNAISSLMKYHNSNKIDYRDWKIERQTKQFA